MVVSYVFAHNKTLCEHTRSLHLHLDRSVSVLHSLQFSHWWNRGIGLMTATRSKSKQLDGLLPLGEAMLGLSSELQPEPE